MKKRTIRSLFIVVVFALIIFYLSPLIPGAKDSLPKFWTQKTLKQGLDLQGGMQIVLEVDTSKLANSEKDDAVKSAREIISNRIDQFGVAEPSIQRSQNDRIIIQLPGLQEFSRAKELIGKTALLQFKLLAEPDDESKALEALDNYFKNNINKYPELKAWVDENQLMEDEESLIDDADSTQVDTNKEISYDTVFTDLVSTEGSPFIVAKENISLVKSLLKDKRVQRVIPKGLQLSFEKEDSTDPNRARRIFVLFKESKLEGKYLQNAKVQMGSGYDLKKSNKPSVGLEFNKRGAKIFENVTGANIGKRLAIVLDGVTYMAPTIQAKIRGGEAQITGLSSLDEAQDLVIVLKAGNLPAPVNIIEERTIGASLGADSIAAGKKAAIYGLIVVALFMLVYYGLSGFLADIAVLVNVLFILAALTFFEATLTLPGIAGIILTIGMSVDANVLIFERIREELRKGKTVRSAVEAGFSRAVVTILDANITTLITALVLFQFGTGPIKGFAVTLSIGIVGSMFTAIILVKAMFDSMITNKNRDKLSI